ncbi:InlB B-repeat-containing protein, partial [uncultured Faecalibacterium sp.]|uniref:InlB B-repeat-containing protein n=1 Tax=uncultured Faecalibacterium sp. TaxID=259315 RepID=UPI0025E49862
MKQGKLIRRAVSAALAGCMMFTFSAPALAESTDALMQLSMTRRSAVSVLDAENGDTANYGFTIDLNGTTKTVNESNCKDIFEDEKLSYDPTTNKLTNKGTISGELTIDAPNVDVELTGNSFVIYGSNPNLNIKNARNVTLSTNSFSVVGGLYSGNAEINCSGKLTIKNSDFTWSAIQDNLTVHNASEILVEGRFSTVVGGDVKIECACPATFKNNQNGGIAKSITYAGDDVYYTSDAADTAIDPNVMPIPVETAKYVRIAPKMRYNIYTAEDAAIKLQGQNTELKTAFAGEKVTVTAAGKENAEFTGWTDLDSVLTSDQLKAKEVTFTMPDKSVTLIPNYNVVQDYGLEVGSENTTPTRVTSKNCKDILGNGMLSYDPTTQTLKSNSPIKRSSLKINAPQKDINLDGKDQIAVAAKLIVENAHNVKVSSDKYAAIFARDDTSTIDCTGEVDISGGFMAVNGSLNIINSSKVNIYTNCAAAVNYDATITSKGDVTIESTDGRAAKNLTIDKADNVTVIIKDTQAISENTKITASGTVILKNTAEGGPVGTVDFTQAGDKDYVYYTSDEPDAKLIDPRIHPLAEAAGSSYLRIEPRETYYSITVANGTAQVGDDTTGRITTAFEGETVTVKANAPTDEDAAKGVKFHHWKVEEGSASFAPTAGSLGSATEAGTAEISFDMPKGNVKLTAVYSVPASVLRSTVTVEGGTAKSTLGEGSDI